MQRRKGRSFKALRQLVNSVAAALLSFSAATYADMTCTAAGCTGVPWSVRANIGGDILISPKQNGSMFTETTCTPYFNTILLENTKPGKDAIYAALLTAITKGESIYIRTQDDTATCNPIYVVSYK